MIPSRLVSRIRREPASGCWVWTGVIDKGGYGRLGGRLAHRLTYQAVVGEIPAGLDLDHLCRNRRCVNPSHLEPVSRQTNVDRGSKATQSHCKHGHAFDSANTYIHPRYGTQECRACRAVRERERVQRKRDAA